MFGGHPEADGRQRRRLQRQHRLQRRVSTAEGSSRAELLETTPSTTRSSVWAWGACRPTERTSPTDTLSRRRRWRLGASPAAGNEAVHSGHRFGGLGHPVDRSSTPHTLGGSANAVRVAVPEAGTTTTDDTAGGRYPWRWRWGAASAAATVPQWSFVHHPITGWPVTAAGTAEGIDHPGMWSTRGAEWPRVRVGGGRRGASERNGRGGGGKAAATAECASQVGGKDSPRRCSGWGSERWVGRRGGSGCRLWRPRERTRGDGQERRRWERRRGGLRARARRETG